MTLQAALARPLMALASALTPPSRAQWSLAMRQEFEALQGGPGSLGWATGCLANALGWRVRTELVFFGSLAAAVLLTSWLTGLIFFASVDYAGAAGFSWLPLFAAAQQIAHGLVCFALALVWPKRAAIIAVCIPLTVSGGAMASFFMEILLRSGGDLPTLQAGEDGLFFLGMEMWPSLLGAALGWGLSRLWRARRTAAA